MLSHFCQSFTIRRVSTDVTTTSYCDQLLYKPLRNPHAIILTSSASDTFIDSNKARWRGAYQVGPLFGFARRTTNLFIRSMYRWTRHSLIYREMSDRVRRSDKTLLTYLIAPEVAEAFVSTIPMTPRLTRTQTTKCCRWHIHPGDQSLFWWQTNKNWDGIPFWWLIAPWTNIYEQGKGHV